jgi:hypothetical protein
VIVVPPSAENPVFGGYMLENRDELVFVPAGEMHRAFYISLLELFRNPLFKVP